METACCDSFRCTKQSEWYLKHTITSLVRRKFIRLQGGDEDISEDSEGFYPLSWIVTIKRMHNTFLSFRM